MVRKRKKKKLGMHIFIMFLSAFTIVALGKYYVFERGYDKPYSSLGKSSDSDGKTTPVPLTKHEPDALVPIFSGKLYSPSAILIRLEDNTILMQKNSEEKIYPASLTKMMTAIVAIENLPDLKKEIKLTNSMYQELYDANASMAGFEPGEQVGAIDLLYGVLLPSGAECCIGLADYVAGSEQNFVEMMNQKAAELGMENTNFENTTGLHDENHYTTVKDQSILLSYALQNDTFKEIFTSSSHSTQPTNKHPNGITFYSTMFKKLGDPSIIGGEILGGKTGYTKEAGLCLASLAKEGAKEYILVTAGAKGNNRSEQYNIIDAVAVYNNIGN